MSRDMSAVPPPERDRKLSGTGTRLLLVGIVLVAIGVALFIPLNGTAAGIGAAIGFLGALPLIAGLVLMVSAAVSRRSRAGKPFA
jgi:uncharacterized membrane protein HdeD (DUF308 family)